MPGFRFCVAGEKIIQPQFRGWQGHMRWERNISLILRNVIMSWRKMRKRRMGAVSKDEIQFITGPEGEEKTPTLCMRARAGTTIWGWVFIFGRSHHHFWDGESRNNLNPSTHKDEKMPPIRWSVNRNPLTKWGCPEWKKPETIRFPSCPFSLSINSVSFGVLLLRKTWINPCQASFKVSC